MQCVNSHDQHLASNHKLELCGSLPEVRCRHQTGILPHTLERTGTVALLHKVERDIQLIRYPHCRGQPEGRTVRFWQRHSNSCWSEMVEMSAPGSPSCGVQCALQNQRLMWLYSGDLSLDARGAQQMLSPLGFRAGCA
jgi:hypothetical protein